MANKYFDTDENFDTYEFVGSDNCNGCYMCEQQQFTQANKEEQDNEKDDEKITLTP